MICPALSTIVFQTIRFIIIITVLELQLLDYLKRLKRPPVATGASQDSLREIKPCHLALVLAPRSYSCGSGYFGDSPWARL